MYILPDGTKYDGAIKNNVAHGKGTKEWKDGTKYVGTFVNNK